MARNRDPANWIADVGDDAVPVLVSFPSLRLVDLSGTAVTDKGVAKLHGTKPQCKILIGGLEFNSAPQ
jgi:hypothetical protein